MILYIVFCIMYIDVAGNWEEKFDFEVREIGVEY